MFVVNILLSNAINKQPNKLPVEQLAVVEYVYERQYSGVVSIL